MTRRLRPILPALLGLVLLAVGCAGSQPDPHYRPAQNVLEVIAVLRRHVPDDTYRFEPARDFTGRNVYRSSLLRLESLELLHAEALRAGHMDGAITFAKGRALERLRAYDLAAGEYRLAARREPELSDEARRSAALCEGLAEATALAARFDPLAAGAEDRELDPDAEGAVDAFEARLAALETLRDEAGDSHHAAIVMEEIERTDIARAEYFAALRRLLPEGDVRAVAEAQRVVMRHRESKNLDRRLLALADLYADMAREYGEGNPPESLRFDPVRFEELLDAATRLYEMVAHKDGTPAKLEAARRLEAFLAFALSVDRDRFTP